MNPLPSLPFVFLLAAATLAPSTLSQRPHDPAVEAFHGNPAWRRLLADTDGAWSLDWNVATGTPRALYGRGITLTDWRGNSLEEARRHALQVLRDRGDLLGLGTAEFRETIGSRMGRTWSFVFEQFYRGLPCIGGRADVRDSMAGRIAMLGSTAWRIPADLVTTPTMPPEAAQVAAMQVLATDAEVPPGTPQTAGAAPRLVIWGDVHASSLQTPVLAWEVPVHAVGDGGIGKIGRYYVDATTAAVLQFASDKHACGLHCNHDGAAATDPAASPTTSPPPVPTTITVMGAVRTSSNIGSPVANVPMPGLKVQVAGHGSFVTDANGRFTVDLTAPATLTVTPLEGIHHATIAGTDVPPGTFQISPGAHGSVWVPNVGSPPTMIAHLNTSWWTHRTNEFVRAVLGDTPELDVTDSIGITVNVALTCNAYYNANSMTFYAAGGGCLNMAESTILVHEWGHGLDDRYGGISQGNGLSEGWGDILAMYLTDQPLVGQGFRGAGTLIRTGNNARQYPTGATVHQQGESWMGFAWKLRERLATTRGRPTAIAVTNDIVLGTIVADATDQAAAMLEVWLADDNDGDLTNGTPHAAELIWAADQHNLPDPAPAGLPNDQCSFPFELTNGLNGPFTNVGATMTAFPFSCSLAGADVWFSYPVGAAGTLDISTCGLSSLDTVIEVFRGDCNSLQLVACDDESCGSQTRVQAAVQPGMHLIRVGGYLADTGGFSLQVSGVPGNYATASSFGTECGKRSRSCYEAFAPGQFDLANTSFRMLLQGDHYAVQPGGSWLTPTGAAVNLGLGDESSIMVNLPAPFPHLGETSTLFEVCSNGWVAPHAGNAITPDATAANFLAGLAMRWGTLHDYDPSAPGSGQIVFEMVGSRAVVTWNGVYTWQATQPNYQQLQFDTATGEVTCVFQAMPVTNNSIVVGFSATGTTTDFGAYDLSTAVPATFTTGAQELLPPTLTSNLPRLGRSLTFTSTFPTPPPLAVQLLGLLALDPGVPLGAYGLPGCRQHTSGEVAVLLVPAAGVATYTMAIPTDGAFLGLPLAAQTVTLPASSNLADLGFSRGRRLQVGL